MLLLFGQDNTFFDLLEAQADAAHRAAVQFYTMSQEFDRAAEHSQAIKRIEAEADELTHQLVNKADAKFVTPLDKEDLHALSDALDDITDLIEAAAARITLYRLTVPRPDFAPLVRMLEQSTQATREAVSVLRHLRDRKSLQENFVRIHDLENKSDQAYRQALADLFNEPNADPLQVIKWKEVYDRIEIAADKCENVSDILESLVVKYA